MDQNVVIDPATIDWNGVVTRNSRAMRRFRHALDIIGIHVGFVSALKQGLLPAAYAEPFMAAIVAAGKRQPKPKAGQPVRVEVGGEIVTITDDMVEVLDCKHSVAVLREIVALVTGEKKQDARPQRFYCAGCKRVGRSGSPVNHHTLPPLNNGACDAIRCACPAFEQGDVYFEHEQYFDRTPDVLHVGDASFKQLGRGASRVVYDLGCGTHCIKIAYGVGHGDRFPFQNDAEIKFWQRANAMIREFLVPVYAMFPDHRATIVQKIDNKRPDDPLRAMLAEAKKQGLMDLHDANIGWNNGKPIIMDYGFAPGSARARHLGR